MISVSVKHTTCPNMSQLDVTAEWELSSKQMKPGVYCLFLFSSPGMRSTSRPHKSWMTCQKPHPVSKAAGKMCCAASCSGRLWSPGPKPKQALQWLLWWPAICPTRTDPLYYRIQLVTYPSLIHVPLVSLVPTEPGICALFLKWWSLISCHFYWLDVTGISSCWIIPTVTAAQS